MKTLLLVSATLFLGHAVLAQVPDSEPAPAQSQPQAQPASSAPANNNANSQSSFLGKDVPFFDPGNETVTWDGKSWNATDNRFFQARFEKYLNAPAETDAEAEGYDATIKQILELLGPRAVTPKTLDQAFGLLTKAAGYTYDANLCDTIANQVYSAWQSQQDTDRMEAATTALDDERSTLEHNKLITLTTETFAARPAPPKGGGPSTQQQADNMRLQATVQPYDQRIVEINLLMKDNQVKRALKEMEAKVDFQSLIVQLFMQRRFQHVLIATRFYRNVFTDGDSEMQVKGSSKDLFDKTTGMPPTVSTVDAMANEVIRDVAEGVDAYNFLMERGELDSATKRLSESYLVGEFLPPIRTLSRDKKRASLAYAQKANQLVNAIEVKDYTLAEKLVNEMQDDAKDFDSSKPMAAIQTAKTIAALHLAKAQNAAVAHDQVTLEAELKAATEIWPRNPALADIAGMIFTGSNMQNKALIDLDQLISQKNYRQIFDDRERFAAAVASDPQRQAQLRKVLDEMTEIEKAIVRAQEIEKRGDFAGAWESAEDAYTQYPTDSKLDQIRADLTTEAADFVGSLRHAQDLEKRGETGSSLAWFLKAQHQYPNSDYARKGIERITKQILPDST